MWCTNMSPVLISSKIRSLYSEPDWVVRRLNDNTTFVVKFDRFSQYYFYTTILFTETYKGLLKRGVNSINFIKTIFILNQSKLQSNVAINLKFLLYVSTTHCYMRDKSFQKVDNFWFNYRTFKITYFLKFILNKI